MQLISDSMRLTMLRAAGAELVKVHGTEIWAIVDDGYAEVLGVETTDPFLTCRTSDVANHKVARNDFFTVRDKQYRGMPQKDIDGFTRIELTL